jgi:hypothetical protein
VVSGNKSDGKMTLVSSVLNAFADVWSKWVFHTESTDPSEKLVRFKMSFEVDCGILSVLILLPFTGIHFHVSKSQDS